MKTFRTYLEEAANQDFYNDMYTRIHGAATRRGASNPEVIARLGAAQASLETGHGKHMVGNNPFGIKGKGPGGSVEARTREVLGGQDQYITDKFRKYDNFDQAADDYVDFLHRNKRYKDVVSAPDIDTAIAAQGKSGYATDPRYGEVLAKIHKERSLGTPNVSSDKPQPSDTKAVAQSKSSQEKEPSKEPESSKPKVKNVDDYTDSTSLTTNRSFVSDPNVDSTARVAKRMQFLKRNV